MEESYFKKLGFHIRPTNQLLVECLKKKVRMVFPTADFPIVDRDLYSGDPWTVFRDDDPWEIEETSDQSSFVRRSIFVYTKLKMSGKRFKRTTNNGTWDGRSTDEPITAAGDPNPEYGSNYIIGSKSYFQFKAKNDLEGTRHRHGHWTMHQIKLAGESLKGLEGVNCAAALHEAANVQVLCTITQMLEKDSPAYCTWPKGILDEYMEEYMRLGFFTPAVGTHTVVAAGGSKKRKFSASTAAADDQCNSKKKLVVYEDNPKSSDDQVQLTQETINSFSKLEEGTGEEEEDSWEWGEFAEELNQEIPKDGEDQYMSTDDDQTLVEHGEEIAASSVSQVDDHDQDMIIISTSHDDQLKASNKSAGPELEEEEDDDDDDDDNPLMSSHLEKLMETWDADDINLPHDVLDLPLCDIHIPGHW